MSQTPIMGRHVCGPTHKRGAHRRRRLMRHPRLAAIFAALMLTVSAGAVVTTLAVPASAETATLTASADTYTRQDAPTTNFGTAVRFSAQGSAGFGRTSLLRFPTSVPAGQQLTKAEVKLTVNSGTKTTGGVALYTTDNTWTETGTTWNTQPAPLLALGSRAPLTAGSVQTWDVTTVVPKTGTGSLDLQISSIDPGWYGFRSREGTTGKPVLLLTTEPVPTPTTTTSPPPTTTATTAPPSEDGTQAAVVRDWGSVVAGDEFSTGTVPSSTNWNLYNSAGHNGQGVRSRAAWSVQGGYARVSGDAAGTTGGMSAKYAGADRKMGRWEVRVRASDVEPKYHPVGILWPTSGNWPCDGEIDFVEKPGSSSGQVGFYNHYGCSNSQTTVKRTMDWSQWHNYAVEWTSSGVVGYLDGVEWFRDSDVSHLPPGAMHQTLQLDWFPVSGQATTPSTFDIAWVRQYDLTTSPTTTTTTSPTPTTTTTTSPTPTTTTTTPAPAGDVRLAAVGDMNGAGSYGTTTPSGKNASSIASALASGDVSAFLGLGDFQYSTAYCADYVNYWNKAGWAAVKPYTYWISAPNHDYEPGRNTDLAKFMDGRCAGDTTKSLTNVEKGSIGDTAPYSFDKGKWHVAALSTALWRYDVPGANAATAWLDNDLAAAKARGQHLIVMYHDPYFTSSTSAHTRATEVKPWVDVIDKYDVRLTLSGSQHNYERSCPVQANDTCTADNGTGTTAFQVSTGGQTLRAFTDSPAYIVARQSTTDGWLRLVLHPDGSFNWTFMPTNGTFTESGTRPAIG